jgi:hypothetical protein
MSENLTASQNHAFAGEGGALNLVTRAVQDGASDAREAAVRTWAATSRFSKRFVYTTCYTISYGVVFPSMLLANSIPRNNAAVRGLIDGAQAAGQKVDHVLNPAHDRPAEGPAPACAPA